jgi:SAM-dependent MidA family methyltransferase
MLEPFRKKIEWRNSLEPFTGVHFSNELLDAMPVRLIEGDVEKLVDLQDDQFEFIERPRSSTSFNQAALDWVDSVAANLQRGYVVTIDYGRSGDEPQGDIQVRAQHRYLDSPFEQIGCADITMHVDWMSIAARARAAGLGLAGFADQHHFLTGIISAWPDLLQGRSSNSTRENFRSQVPITAIDDKTKRALKTLLHPEMLGRSFQILALEKGVDPVAPLAGFKFAHDPPFA